MTHPLDAADPLAGFTGRFQRADGVVAYLDGNSLGRPVAGTGERLSEFVAGPWGTRLIRGWDEAWMNLPTDVGDRLGGLVLGAAPGQSFVGDSTSVLLYKLIRAGVDAAGGRDTIVIERDNFPTDRFIVEGIAAERGLRIRWIETAPDAGVRLADLDDVLDDDTALVVLSHVAYRSGFLADAAAITARVHEAGALMLWDLCHSAGVVPVELDAWDADLAVGCTYKYLCGGPGSPAFGYVNARLHDTLSQPVWGWMGAADPFDMSPAYAPARGIRRFITGTPPVLAMQPLLGLLDLIEEAGLDAIRAKSVALTEHAIDLVDTHLAPRGATLSSPRAASERGSHVTVDHPSYREGLAELWRRGVIPDFRPPRGLRLGLSPLSTSFEELERGVAVIAEVMDA